LQFYCARPSLDRKQAEEPQPISRHFRFSGFIVIVPAVFLSDRLIEEATKGAASIRERMASGEWRQTLQANRITAPAAQMLDQLKITELIGSIGGWVTNASAALVRGWIVEAATVLATVYLLFYFLRDRTATVSAIRSIPPRSLTGTRFALAKAPSPLCRATRFFKAASAGRAGLGSTSPYMNGPPAHALVTCQPPKPPTFGALTGPVHLLCRNLLTSPW
jgi:hypothetical protein